MSEKNIVPKDRQQTSFLKSKLIPFMGKLGQQRHLGAIRDAFATLIPLIIAGSIGMLVDAIVFGGAGSGYVSVLGLFAKWAHHGMTNDQVTALLGSTDNNWGKTTAVLALAFGTINTATIGIISLYFSFLFAYYIALSKNFSNPIIAGLTSTAALVLSGLGNISFIQGAPGLIAAIIVSIITTELFIKLSEVRALIIKLPDGVPPAVGKSFAVFLPVAITLAFISCIDIVFLAPAIATQGLHVSTGSNVTLTSWETIQQAIAGYTPTATANASYSNWWLKDNVDIWKGIVAAANSGASELNTYISHLSASKQSIAASMIAIATGNATMGNDVASILTPESTSKISMIIQSGGVILSLNWQSINVAFSGFGFAQAIFQFFSSWFIGLATGNGSLGIALAYVLLVSIFWLFGIHGTNLLMGIFAPIWLMVLAINSNLVTISGSYELAKATGQMGIFGSPFFDSFVFIGGAGCTLTLLTSTLIFSKRQELKEIAKYATPAGCFQINEPVMFGFPIVLNGIYATPFIFTQVANLIIAWFFVKTGMVKMPTIQTPWTAPWFLGAVLSTIDGKAVIPAFINFGVDLLLYVPFTLIDNKVYFSKLKASNIEQYELEMKYYSDPEFRFSKQTEIKVGHLQNKAEFALSDALEINTFLEKRIRDKDKLERLKAQNDQKAKVKYDIYVEKSKALEAKRIQKAEVLKPKWDKLKEKKESKRA